MNTKESKSKFQLHDFNIFVTALIVAMLVLLVPFSIIIRQVFQSVFAYTLADNLSIVLAITVLIASLYWFWKSLDLSPLPIKGREEEWRRGHGYIAAGNMLVVIPVVIVLLLVLISGNPNNGLYLWWAMPAWGIAIICWVVGAGSVGKSSRYDLPKR